jgi:hypothetical protein
VINDQVAAGIMHGSKFVDQFGQRAAPFILRRRDPSQRSHAWYWDESKDPNQFQRLLESGANPNRKPSDLTLFWLYRSPAMPVPCVRSEPELQEYVLETTGPGMLILSELAYPGWQAKINWPDGRTTSAQTLVSQAGCLMVRITTPGKYHVELNYRSHPFERGSVISLASMGLCLMFLLISLSVRWRIGRSET